MGKKKKKKRDGSAAIEAQIQPLSRKDESELFNGDSHETKRKKKQRKRRSENENTDKPKEMPTVSIAVPGSIIDNAQSLELATRVVIFDNKSSSMDGSNATMVADSVDDYGSGAAFLIRILQYLETPQYLRKSLFLKHSSLRFVGLLPPLDAPHHLRKHEWAPFREGVTKERASNFSGTLVDVGLNKDVLIDEVREPGTRVTIAMGINRNLDAGCIILRA